MQEKASKYYADPEKIEEVGRVQQEERLLTEYMPLFPPGIVDQLPVHARVLDLGCGTGGWILTAAEAYEYDYEGVDNAPKMVELAGLYAQAEGRENVRFRKVDVTQFPMPYEAESFDFVRGRLLHTFLHRDEWPLLIKEMYRLLRPGGYACIVEFEAGFIASDPIEAFNEIFARGMYAQGRGFSQRYGLGVCKHLAHWYREAGFSEVRGQAHAIDTQGSRAWQAELFQLYQAILPDLINSGVTTMEEMSDLFSQAAPDLVRPDIPGLNYFYSAWARKRV